MEWGLNLSYSVYMVICVQGVGEASTRPRKQGTFSLYA